VVIQAIMLIGQWWLLIIPTMEMPALNLYWEFGQQMLLMISFSMFM
jgi:hypothetical protein